MIYTIDSLKEIIESPIDDAKWGTDTSAIISIVKTILQSNCSSCAMRRNINKLKKLLNAHGDDVNYSPNKYVVKPDENKRIPCIDCVAKHLSQAYILQSEFYQGYTEHLALIEGHLYEALEECPIERNELRAAIKNAIISVTVDRKPNVPQVEYSEADITEDKPNNIYDGKPDVQDDLSIEGSLINLLNNVPTRHLSEARRLLSKGSTTRDDLVNTLKNSSSKWVYFGGHMAQAAEYLAMFAPPVARLLRERRQSVHTKIFFNAIDDIDDIWLSNRDIIKALEDVENSR